MKESHKEFLDLIKDHIHKHKSSNTILHKKEIIEYANSQCLSGLVYYQTQYSELRNAYYNTLIHYEKMKAVHNTIARSLMDKNVEFYFVKGITIAQQYPIPQMRTMGDLDIVIHAGEESVVRAIMKQMGFQCYTGERNQEMKFSKDGVSVEIHNRLIYEDNRNTNIIVQYGDCCWDFVSNHQLSIERHFIYLLLHLRKHIMGEGAGIRQIIDIAILSKYGKLNWEIIYSDLNALEIMPFAQRVFSYISQVFEIIVPINKIKLSSECISTITNKLIADGIFGHFNEENQRNALVNDVNTHGKRQLTKRFLRGVFLSKKQLQRIPQYQYLGTAPILLPLAWIVRAIRKIKDINRIHKDYFEIEDYLEKRNELFELWGIKRTKLGK